MTIFLDELLDYDILASLINEGYVSAKKHPSLPYTILNYTKKTQIEGQWTHETMLTRGLIYNHETTEIVSRPFPKFFNYGEPGSPIIPADMSIVAYDKMDGSLGILYPSPNARHGYAVATRGSFTSDQAIWATEWLNRQDKFPWLLRESQRSAWTPLVEIIYPDNRIVVNYDYEGLVYLGDIDIYAGSFLYDPDDWDGRVAPVLYTGPFDGLFDLPDRENAEGVVVYAPPLNDRVKVKYEEYKRIHRLVFGLTKKGILDMLISNPDALQDRIADLPEEHQDWANAAVDEFNRDYVHFWQIVDMWIRDVDYACSQGKLLERKEVALFLQENSAPAWIRNCVFLWLDSRNYSDVIWKQVQIKFKETENNASDAEAA